MRDEVPMQIGLFLNKISFSLKNTSQEQSQASAEEVRAEVTKHYIDQIDNANLKIRERENKIKSLSSP